ncbi:MAG: hypothetical protein PHP52_05140 [Bacteroidales bacterium]|nr:hypothetical protein [Bacteroidales bacterium]MDD4216252.1 hypothetical protein [Bacteroidales bacterium]
MKNNFGFFTLMIFVSFIFHSCNNSNNNNSTNNNNNSQNEKKSKQSVVDYTGEKLVITDKIMYDVQICNEIIGDRSKNNPDWFWENLPTPESDEFIKALLDDAINGKLKTYYYDLTSDCESFDEIAQEDLKSYMNSVMTYEFEVIDSTVKRYKTIKKQVPLTYKHVKKLRFLEEWFVADGVFHKKVIAVAPYFVIEYPGFETYNTVYFWIMINKN